MRGASFAVCFQAEALPEGLAGLAREEHRKQDPGLDVGALG